MANRMARGPSKKTKENLSNSNEHFHESKQQINSSSHLLDKAEVASKGSQGQLQIIKDIYSKIVLQPQEHLKHIETIFLCTKSNSVLVCTTALRTLAQIFTSIAPLQAINLDELDRRKRTTLLKEEYKVIRFQQSLVGQYQRYLKMLKEMNSKLKGSDFGSDNELFVEFKKCLLHCLIKCYETLWNFNHFKLLNLLMLKFIRYPECKSTLSLFLQSRNIAILPAKFRIVTDIGHLIRQKPQSSLPDDLINLVNQVHIDTRYLQKDQQYLKFKKRKLTKKLYRQQAQLQKKEKERKDAQRGTLEMKARLKEEKARQKLKIKEEVNKEFAEGDAILSNKELVRNNSALLQQLFYIYFKILVERVHSKYLSDCLTGVLTFAHLINIELISSLLENLTNSSEMLRDSWKQQKTVRLLESRLQVVFSAQSILNGPLSIFNMDDLKVTTSLLKIMRDIATMKEPINKEIFKLICLTYEQAFLKRRQLSQEVVGSFVKELSKLVLRQEVPKLYCLEMLRMLVSKYSKVGRMFEEDNEGYGLHNYNAHCEDPQCTNAINTQVISNIRKLANTKQTEQYQRVSRLIRQNYNRIDNSANIQQLLNNDLTLLEYSK